MNRTNITQSINEIYGIKAALLDSLEVITNNTLKAKQAVENAKATAATLPEWADLKNDKIRDAFIKIRFAGDFDALADATEKERMARHQLALTDLEIERLRLLVKINCEWIDALER